MVWEKERESKDWRKEELKDEKGLQKEEGNLPELAALAGLAGLAGLAALAGLAGLAGLAELAGLTALAGLAGLTGLARLAGLAERTLQIQIIFLFLLMLVFSVELNAIGSPKACRQDSSRPLIFKRVSNEQSTASKRQLAVCLNIIT